MNIDKERELFEGSYSEEEKTYSLLLARDGDGYVHDPTQLAWTWWCKRASIEVAGGVTPEYKQGDE